MLPDYKSIYCSKLDPIEHRLFSHISRSWSGTPLLSATDACMRAAKTATKTGLRVFSRVVNKVYETGRKVSDGYREVLASRVIFDTKLHKWNYLINHAWSFYFIFLPLLNVINVINVLYVIFCLPSKNKTPQAVMLCGAISLITNKNLRRLYFFVNCE